MKTFLFIFVVSFSLFCLSGCKGGGKYADDIIKAVDDKVDDAAKIVKPNNPKVRPRTIDCSQCSNGIVYDPFYNCYTKCSNCGGNGRVTIYEQIFD